MALDGKKGQESLDLRRCQIARMALPVEQDETLDPIDVGLLGAQTIMLEANPVADAIEQTGSRSISHFLPRFRPLYFLPLL